MTNSLDTAVIHLLSEHFYTVIVHGEGLKEKEKGREEGARRKNVTERKRERQAEKLN